MSLDTLKKVQYIEQDILDYVVEFCEKNSIEYWLDWGTLLGCIRHKGFIPWDDDIDIAMPRNEYNRFIKLFKEKGENIIFKLMNKNDNFKLVDNSVEKYNYPFIRIVNLKHFSISNKRIVGIWVDIFPLDYYPKEGIDKLKIIALYREKNNILRQNKNFFNKILLEFFRIKRKELYKKLDKIKNKSDRYGLAYSLDLNEKIWYFDKNKIYPLVEREFNGKKYKTPNNYDYYLKKEYGDYMTLPKEEDRQIHLKIEETIFDEEDLERIMKKYNVSRNSSNLSSRNGN